MAMTDLPENFLHLDNQLCFVLYAVSRKVIQSYAPLLKALDLTYTQYITLLVLWERPVLTVKALGEYLLLDTGTLTPLLKKLEAKGLLKRTRSKMDERSVLIELTPQGQEMKTQTACLFPELLSTLTFDSEEMADLRERLKSLLVSLGSV
jgi:MarR family transcriptional regulator, organic hydroperoxide resistance regulator